MAKGDQVEVVYQGNGKGLVGSHGHLHWPRGWHYEPPWGPPITDGRRKYCQGWARSTGKVPPGYDEWLRKGIIEGYVGDNGKGDGGVVKGKHGGVYGTGGAIGALAGQGQRRR